MRNTRFVAAVVLACLIAPRALHAATLNVPADFATIQGALDAAVAGDVVLVAPGTYSGPLYLGTQQNGVRLASVAGPQVTTIDGRRSGAVILCANVGPWTSVEGFTITGGGTLPLTNTVGGGMFLAHTSMTVSGNIIRDNTCGVAAGMYVDGGSPLIVGNIITGNSAVNGSGGGIYFDHGTTAAILDNVISDNSCAEFGGGVTVWEGSTPVLEKNTIVGNHAAMGGGGLYVTMSSYLSLTATIVAFNTDGGVVMGSWGFAAFWCSDVFGNTPVNFTGMSDPSGTNGNQSADPLFCSLAGGDLHLSSYSPCAPGNSPSGCGRVGALDPQCSATPVIRSTWGTLKARYR